MGRVGIVTHPAYLEHDMGRQHPESPERLRAIVARLESTGTMSKLTRVSPRKAETKWITHVHDPAYVQRLEDRAPSTGYASLDSDTSLSPGSLPAAHLAVGGALAAVDAVMATQVDQVFCAFVRRGTMPRPIAPWGFACIITWRLRLGTSRNVMASSAC